MMAEFHKGASVSGSHDCSLSCLMVGVHWSIFGHKGKQFFLALDAWPKQITPLQPLAAHDWTNAACGLWDFDPDHRSETVIILQK